MYLPDEVMIKVEDRLLPACIWTEEEDSDHDELVLWAIEIIDMQLENTRFRIGKKNNPTC
ncbi:hypothetical protein QGM71_18350 [Virgibacillus sp. C22-A2]|uniref:Uncharacterized protein n=1 Tax=Virgibacillus tibetensis TaxID=3042313 RepID=A0ABU6KKN9_9BACI|nr:hypothetical protein [Virgibacillus sp. C22-A2]